MFINIFHQPYISIQQSCSFLVIIYICCCHIYSLLAMVLLEIAVSLSLRSVSFYVCLQFTLTTMILILNTIYYNETSWLSLINQTFCIYFKFAEKKKKMNSSNGTRLSEEHCTAHCKIEE